MQPERIVVFLPCHTLGDFPAQLDDAEADDVLAAWTAPWTPELIAAVGRPPGWASMDVRPPDDVPLLGIVPAAFDGRFAAQADATCLDGSCWVRGVSGREAVTAAAVAAAGLAAAAERPHDPLREDFQALGLAVLLGELLARRMRSAANLEATGFAAAVVAAARAALEDRGDEARAGLRECFGYLEAARSRYYPVDLWLVDLVLLAESTLGRPLLEELESPTPLGVVATGRVVNALAERQPPSLARLRERCAAGAVSACGGWECERPLDACSAEEILASLDAGIAAWRGHVGVAPTTGVRCSGGSSAILPQLLTGFGFAGAVWSLFDGTPLPDPHHGRIQWEGTGGGMIPGLGRAPLDARRAGTILGLPERISDVMDHDHTAVLMLAHHAGTASPWFGLLRTVGAWTTALGTFVTPAELFTRTAGAGSMISFKPDDFPCTPPPAEGDPLAASIAATEAEARRIVAAAEAIPVARLPVGTAPELAAGHAAGSPVAPPRRRRTRAGDWFGTGARAADGDLVLDNGAVRMLVHGQTGSLLSLRRPDDRINRVSQQLALRTTRKVPPQDSPWGPPEEHADHSRMRADAVARVKALDGTDCIESRGRLLADGDREVGAFVQRMSLAAGLPLAVLELEVRLPAPLAGPTLEHHVACRFAWHENDDVEICRSLHTQAVPTQRGWFTAPHFITLRSAEMREPEPGDVTILTGGLPWHVVSGEHMLDSILLAAGGTTAVRRMAVGIGLARPWDAALAFLAGSGPIPAPAVDPDHVRITLRDVIREGDRVVRATVGLLESAGRSGEVRIDWQADVIRAEPLDLRGMRRENVAVAIEGRSTVVFLHGHEWLHLDLEFRG